MKSLFEFISYFFENEQFNLDILLYRTPCIGFEIILKLGMKSKETVSYENMDTLKTRFREKVLFYFTNSLLLSLLVYNKYHKILLLASQLIKRLTA